LNTQPGNSLRTVPKCRPSGRQLCAIHSHPLIPRNPQRGFLPRAPSSQRGLLRRLAPSWPIFQII
jgi:hypothetical protein